MIASGDLDFSFSGLKTSVLTRVRALGALDEATRADLAASFQAAIVDVLVAKCVHALEREGMQRLVVAGGVGANTVLRERLTARARKLGATVYFPPLRLCTDNGAMIAFAAALKYPEGTRRRRSFPGAPALGSCAGGGSVHAAAVGLLGGGDLVFGGSSPHPAAS